MMGIEWEKWASHSTGEVGPCRTPKALGRSLRETREGLNPYVV